MTRTWARVTSTSSVSLRSAASKLKRTMSCSRRSPPTSRSDGLLRRPQRWRRRRLSKRRWRKTPTSRRRRFCRPKQELRERLPGEDRMEWSKKKRTRWYIYGLFCRHDKGVSRITSVKFIKEIFFLTLFVSCLELKLWKKQHNHLYLQTVIMSTPLPKRTPKKVVKVLPGEQNGQVRSWFRLLFISFEIPKFVFGQWQNCNAYQRFLTSSFITIISASLIQARSCSDENSCKEIERN